VLSQARTVLYGDAYVWLVDSQAVGSFASFEDIQASASDTGGYWGNRCHNGWLKLEASLLDDAWFERLARFNDECYAFDRRESEPGCGDWWYEPS
jgi:hypothetical protein